MKYPEINVTSLEMGYVEYQILKVSRVRNSYVK